MGGTEIAAPERDASHSHGGIGAARWPAAIALLVSSLLYLLLSDQYRVGPPWLLPFLVLFLLIPTNIAHRLERSRAARVLALSITGLVTLAVTLSAIFLVTRLPGGKTPAPLLLRDAALIWGANILAFALWYWELDDGGPAHRRDGYVSTDFLFPQMTMSDAASKRWSPEFIDYVFLAFNTSTAFSPTDTLILSRRMKALMMYQTLVSLLTLSVLIARAINTLS